MKQWYFYNNEGKVNLIYMLEPSKEMMDGGNYIIGDKVADKEGFDTILSVDLDDSKELKIDYIKKEMTLDEKVKMLTEQNKKLTKDLANAKIQTEKVSKQSEEVNASLMKQMMTLKFSIMNK